MKPTHDSLLLRVSCLLTATFIKVAVNKHETRSNSESCVGFISLTFL